MIINPFNYFLNINQHSIAVGLFSQVEDDDISPIPPIDSGYRVITQDRGYRKLTNGGFRITTQFMLLRKRK